MQRKTKLRLLIMLSVAIVMSMSVLCGSGPLGRQLRAQTISANASPTPVTPAGSPTPDPDAGLRAACSDTLNELLKARTLIASQDTDIKRLKEVDQLTDQVNTGLKNLRTLDAEQKADLQRAVDAANRVIDNLKGENAVLKKQKMTLLKKATWFVIGAAAGVITGAVLVGR